MSCFLENQVYNFDKSQSCLKAAKQEECQFACQLTSGCSDFSYFTRNFNSSNEDPNEAIREAMDCCLFIDTVDTIDTKGVKSATEKQGVISGPQFCPMEGEGKNMICIEIYTLKVLSKGNLCPMNEESKNMILL